MNLVHSVAADTCLNGGGSGRAVFQGITGSTLRNVHLQNIHNISAHLIVNIDMK